VVAVEDHPVGLEALRGDLGQRSLTGPAQRSGHPELVALLVRRVTDPHGHRPPQHLLGRDLTLGPGELLRVVDAAEVRRSRHHRRHGHRPGPGAPSHLVDPDHDLFAGAPAAPLEPEGGRHPRRT
jgi:hypothetical protein